MEGSQTTTIDPSKAEATEKVWGLYKKYCAHLGQKSLAIKRSYYNDNSLKLNRYYDAAWGACMDEIEELESQIKEDEKYPARLDKLDLDLSGEEIEEKFNKYGVIQLRKIDHNSSKLLLGCGNNPIDDFLRLRGHYHKGMTTINPTLTMNPTIVAAFGVDDLSDVLPPKQYDVLAVEFFGNLHKTDQLVKALKGPYFKQSDLDVYYDVQDVPCEAGRGSVRRDENGDDFLTRGDLGLLFAKKGLPDASSEEDY